MFDNYQMKSSVRDRRLGMPEVRPTVGKKLKHPAAHAPLIFADTADIKEIEPLYRAGIISGVTTNPTLVNRAGAKSKAEADAMIKALLKLVAPNPVNVELTELTEDAMVKQAEEIASWADNVVIKVPSGGYEMIDPSYDPFTGLKVIRRLWEKDIVCNATLVFNSTQAYWAAIAGASYVSPFLGRLADYAYKHDHVERAAGNSLYWIEDHKDSKGDQKLFNSEYVACGGARKNIGPRLIQEISTIFTNYDIKTQVLCASFRNVMQLTECLLAGADILTAPANVLAKVVKHPLTEEGMVSFFADSKVFEK